jgi:tRNA-Thr(GGU) m(6)t(6)A37 methyltransferase TsaA
LIPIQLTPIGIVHSPHTVLAQTPRQTESARGIGGTIELDPAFAAGLKDLDGFSYVWLLVHLHAAHEVLLELSTARGEPLHGIFATRTSYRPNPIGLSVVRLVSIEGCVLHIEDIDLLDGTPVLDIKPYVPVLDQHAEASNGWYAWHFRE